MLRRTVYRRVHLAADENAVGTAHAPRRFSVVQILFWTIAILAGALQTWNVRFDIFSDGVSYLDIADHYARGDWRHAINAYWSPFYSWVLALVDVIFKPGPYWSEPSLHLVNYAAYLVSLLGLELFLSELVRFQRQSARGVRLSEITLRVAAYASFLFAGILLIGIGYCSPDMIAMAVVFFVSYLLLRIANALARFGTFFWLGVWLAIGYLSRAAFLPIAALSLVIACVLVAYQGKSLWRATAPALAPVLILAGPFVVALSVQQGHLSFGETGKANYAWELNGAARSTHWQGEPGDIGKPLHPTHKVLNQPATYTFAEPVAGVYPPWYDPSYWYAGVKPHLELGAQLKVIAAGLALLIYLFFRSPAALPWLALVMAMGPRHWFSKDRILGYWFILVPALAYIGVYVLVFMDQRYIAGSLVIVWTTFLASVSVPDRAKGYADRLVRGFAILCALGLLMLRLGSEAKSALRDLIHPERSLVNISYVLARRFHELGLKPGDGIAFIGLSIDQDWTRLDGVRIVAEVPIVWTRSNSLMRRVLADRSEPRLFWQATPEQQARVFDVFRQAGAVMVVADSIPKYADHSGWKRILGDDELRLPADYPERAAAYGVYRWLSN